MVGNKHGERRLILLFFMPAILVWLGILIVPFFYGIFISFTQWDGLGNDFTFVGLRNYLTIFGDSKFLDSLLKTSIYAVAVVIVSNVIAIGLGLLLTSALKGKTFFRTAMFTPNIIGGLILGYLWKFILTLVLRHLEKAVGSRGLRSPGLPARLTPWPL